MNMKTVDDQINTQSIATMENLLSELSHYRNQSEKLKKINTLHQILAGILDFPAMIEAYSIWLMEFVDHDLIGYNNLTHQCMHMFCSYHGPKKRQALQLAQKILEQPFGQETTCTHDDGFRIHKWEFNSIECRGLLVLLSKGKPFSEEASQLIDDSLVILADPLKRAMEYEKMFTKAHRDSLTGLSNRFVFKERIGNIIEQANRHGHPLTLAALDLDHFKAINDSMGHAMGDQILKQVADSFNKEIRLTDMLVRMGGDEFLLVMPNTTMQDARFLAERLCQAIEQLDVVTSAGKLTVSIGLSEWQASMSVEAWMEQADDTLYLAKAHGKAQVAITIN